MPEVSVVLCAYNAERYIAETIESVLAQTYKDFELVVVDDGSTDGTRAIVESFAKRSPAVRYHHQPNAGFGPARNKVLELSRGRWIAIIDHDDVCLPDRLAVQIAASEAHPKAVLIFSNSEHFRDDGTIVRRQFDRLNPCGLDLGPGAATEALLTHGCFIDSETAFFKKDAAVAAGGFSEDYRYINDYDMFLRLGMTHAFAGVDRVLARWRVHERQLSETLGETIVREQLQVYREWAGRDDIGERGRRAAKLRLFANLCRSLGRKNLRQEGGGILPVLRQIMGVGPSDLGDYAWCLGRLVRKFK